MLQYIFIAVVPLLLSFYLVSYLRLALRPHPGPFWARWSKAWYFLRVWRGQFEQENIELHKQYGPVVRVTPRWYSIDDPTAAKTIYSHRSKLAKGTWYSTFAPPHHNGDLFADANEARHTSDRKKYQAMYSMTSLVHYEPLVDECSEIFTARLNEFANAGQPLDLGHWLQCYAFDVIGNITCGKRFGFLDEGKDVRGIIAGLDFALLYGSVVGVYSSLHPILSSLLQWLPTTGIAYVVQFSQEAITEKKKSLEDSNDEGYESSQEGRPTTILEKTLRAQADDPEKMTSHDVMMVCRSNIAAGSDTTGITLTAVLYYLQKKPDALKKLREEIQEQDAKGRESPYFTFKQSQEMPYLQAVIKEALRIHPAAGLPLWRAVPDHGLEISEYSIPPGSVVGINPWCAHRNTSVFGKDANVFRPERWLDTDKEKIAAMDSYWMPFGLGSRTCIGRHISMLEISKLIPLLVRDFDVTLEHPQKPWITNNRWFVKPKSLMAKVQKRPA